MSPKCGLSLQKGVKIVAALELISCGVILSALTWMLMDVCFGGKTSKSLDYFMGVKREIQFALWLACWLIISIKLIIDIYLYKGASKKNYEECQIWLNITGVIILVTLSWSLMGLKQFSKSHKYILFLVACVTLVVFKGIEMIIVYKFIQRVKREQLEVFTVPLSSPRIFINDRRWSEDNSRLPSTSTISDFWPNEMHSTSNDSSLPRCYKVIR